MRELIKKGIWGIIACLVLSSSLYAQSRQERHEQIEAIKIAFITNKLDLSSDEAQQFWPVYNVYQKELMELMKKRREDRQKENVDPNDRINADLAYESKMLELKKKYKKIFLKTIPPEKLIKLYQAEREFREHLIKQLNHRRSSN